MSDPLEVESLVDISELLQGGSPLKDPTVRTSISQIACFEDEAASPPSLSRTDNLMISSVFSRQEQQSPLERLVGLQEAGINVNRPGSLIYRPSLQNSEAFTANETLVNGSTIPPVNTTPSRNFLRGLSTSGARSRDGDETPRPETPMGSNPNPITSRFLETFSCSSGTSPSPKDDSDAKHIAYGTAPAPPHSYRGGDYVLMSTVARFLSVPDGGAESPERESLVGDEEEPIDESVSSPESGGSLGLEFQGVVSSSGSTSQRLSIGVEAGDGSQVPALCLEETDVHEINLSQGTGKRARPRSERGDDKPTKRPAVEGQESEVAGSPSEATHIQQRSGLAGRVNIDDRE